MDLLPAWAPNLHALLIHLPIAWWVAAVMADLVALLLPRATWARSTGTFLYPVAAAAAVLTYLSGRQAAATVLVPGMAHPILQEHWNWALATTVGFGLVAVLRLWTELQRQVPSRWLRIVTFAAAAVALGLLVETGHRGGRLVYEHGVGVAQPSGLR